VSLFSGRLRVPVQEAAITPPNSNRSNSMSRIGSMVNQAKQLTQQVDRKVNEAKQQVTQQAAKVVSADTFEGAHGLYDAGAHKSGRQTRERTVTLGRGEDLVGVDSAGRPFEDRVLSGARLHAFAQKAGTVASAGADVFVGGKHEQASVDATGTSKRSLVKVGAEAGATVFAGTVTGFTAGAQAGAELREKTVTRTDLGNGTQLKQASTVEGTWGVVAQAGAEAGTVFGAKVDLFAGARGGGEQRWAITDGTTERGAVAGRFGAMVGVGVLADAEVGYDVDRKQGRVSADAGVALGVGAHGGGELTVGGADED
jgi:hypothetical protein